ncbi:unnamed protein product [Strongylus vulgaris]|uniref:Uncharacterized protein n=1 Tax=Strongylus vulgaris TaxID=40348 RepID=A0A3P7L1V2_STRVU|nr:unnamed protein product [Strongylus vulgaris]
MMVGSVLYLTEIRNLLMSLFAKHQAIAMTSKSLNDSCAVISVLSGTGAIWAGRIFHLGGAEASVSLAESDVNAPIHQYVLRFVIGVVLILSCRMILKPVAKLFVKIVYSMLDLKSYSYSQMCKDIGGMQPTKRYTNRMRFKPILGAKVDDFHIKAAMQ